MNELITTMHGIVQEIYPDKVVMLILYTDLSGHIAYEYATGSETNMSYIFSWGESYSHLLENFVSWLKKSGVLK